MRKHELYTEYHDHFEYFGNTEIERIRKQGEKTIRHDRIIFDTVDEAMEFFNDKCGEFVGYYACGRSDPVTPLLLWDAIATNRPTEYYFMSYAMVVSCS